MRPFPGREPKVTVSTAGGRAPFWSGDGRELFYRIDKEIWSVAVSEEGGFHASRPRRVLAADWLSRDPWGDHLQASRDGTKFLTVRHTLWETPELRIVYAPGWVREWTR